MKLPPFSDNYGIIEFIIYGFQHGSHDYVFNQHFAGCTGYGHDEAGGREALDQAFAEIVGAESSIVRSQVCHIVCCVYFMGLFTRLS